MFFGHRMNISYIQIEGELEVLRGYQLEFVCIF
jgi:hypothetical protein